MTTSAAGQIDSPTAESLSLREVLRIPTMRRLWYAQIISTFGDFLSLFAVLNVLTFQLHATPRQIIELQTAFLIPMAVLGIVAGVLVDRLPHKATMIASDVLSGCFVLLFLGSSKPWHFNVVLLALSSVASFFVPAQTAVIQAVIPAQGLQSANALLQQVFFAVRIVAPTISAFLVANLGPRSCYVLDAISFTLSALLISSLNLKPAKFRSDNSLSPIDASLAGIAPHPPRRHVFADMRTGISFIVARTDMLLTVISQVVAVFVLGCFASILAIYIRDNVHGSARTFGSASAAIGIGIVAGINLLTVLGKRLRAQNLLDGGLAGVAFGLALLGAVSYLASTMLGSFIIGLGIGAIIVPSQTLVQQQTPPELMGRVSATIMSIIFFGQVGGLIVSGFFADFLSTRLIFLACAGLLVIFVAARRRWCSTQEKAHR